MACVHCTEQISAFIAGQTVNQIRPALLFHLVQLDSIDRLPRNIHIDPLPLLLFAQCVEPLAQAYPPGFVDRADNLSAGIPCLLE